MLTTQRRSGHTPAPMDLTLKLPGMGVEESASTTKEKRRTSPWQLGGTPQAFKM